MSWVHTADSKDVTDSADVTVEGIVLLVIDDVVPQSGLKTFGERVFLRGDGLKTLAHTPVGKQLASRVATMGFWMIGESACLLPGVTITAHLIVQSLPGELGILVPVPCASGVVDSLGLPIYGTCGKVDCPNVGAVEGVRDGQPLQIGYSAGFTQYSADMDNGCDIWRSATRNASVSCFWMFETTDPAHYSLFWGDLADDTLAVTTVTVNGRRPGLFSHYRMVFNQRKAWSRPGREPRSNEYDFISVFLHEVGHALGLRHLNDSERNIMYESLASGVMHREVQSDDRTCMRQLY